MPRDAHVGRDGDGLPGRVVDRGDGPRVDVRQPDHDLVDIGATRGVRREQVICNVCDNRARGCLRPVPSSLLYGPDVSYPSWLLGTSAEGTDGHTCDRAQLLVDAIVELDVREALHPRSTCPRPVRLPGDGRPAQANEFRALRAGGRAGRAPEVEEQGIRARCDSVPLAAVRRGIDAALACEQVRGGGNGEEGGEEESKGRRTHVGESILREQRTCTCAYGRIALSMDRRNSYRKHS